MKEKFRTVLFLRPFTVFEILYIKILHFFFMRNSICFICHKLIKERRAILFQTVKTFEKRKNFLCTARYIEPKSSTN